MGRGDSKYFEQIESMLEFGYDAKTIAKLTNIPRSTVYRVVDKLQVEARYKFNNLLEKDYLYQYQITLDNYKKTIRECNEQIEETKKKYQQMSQLVTDRIASTNPRNEEVIAQYTAQQMEIISKKNNELEKLMGRRDKATEVLAKLYNAGPAMAAVEQWLKIHPAGKGKKPEWIVNGDPQPLTQQKTEPLNVDAPKALAETRPEDEEYTQLSPEDLDLLRKMAQENDSLQTDPVEDTQGDDVESYD